MLNESWQMAKIKKKSVFISLVVATTIQLTHFHFGRSARTLFKIDKKPIWLENHGNGKQKDVATKTKTADLN